MSGINNVILDSKINKNLDYYHIYGHYQVSGKTKPENNQGFTADLEIDHAIDLSIDRHINDHDMNLLFQLINKLKTAIVKIKSFRSKECADTLIFAPEGLVTIEHITTTSHGSVDSHAINYYINNLSELEKLTSDITPHNIGPRQADLSSSDQFELEKNLPLKSLPEQRNRVFINSLTDNQTSVEIRGNYSIKGFNDESLALNSGFKTMLSISQCLNVTLTGGSSTTTNHLKDILSTALNKAKAFRNPACQDVLQFAGAFKVKYQDQPEFIYQITDIYSFNLFVDFVSHIKLSAQNNTTTIFSSPESNNQSLNPSKAQIFTNFKYDQGKLRREQSSAEQDDTIDTCWQRLKKFIYS